MSSACNTKPTRPEEPERARAARDIGSTVSPGWYRGTLRVQETSVPFFLRVPDPSSDERPVFLNGVERIEPSHRWEGDRLLIDFPIFDARMTIGPGRELTGKWERLGAYQLSVDLSGERLPEPEPLHRFPASTVGAPGANVAGRWRVELEKQGLGLGTFQQTKEGVVTGSIYGLLQHGDFGHLAGDLRGARLRLSMFDGAYAVRVNAEVDPEKQTMSGTMWINGEPEKFQARHDEGFSLPDPLSQVKLKSDNAQLSLDVLQQSGYRNKPIIVEIFGTWCPNCNDAVVTLVDLYERYHDQGLEMLSLAYEEGSDIEYNMQRVEHFKEHYGVRWQVIVFGMADAEEEDPRLPIVGKIKGVPTTIFVNADGTVRAVYSGFAGPATADHARVEQRFETLTKEIMATRRRSDSGDRATGAR